jgi:hypothetical protein
LAPHQGARIEEHRLRFSTDVHFMLSRATQTPQMLARLDAAIDELQRSGEFRRIAAFYALPVLINQTLDSEWFRVLSSSAPSRSLSPASCSPMRDNTHCSEP